MEPESAVLGASLSMQRLLCADLPAPRVKEHHGRKTCNASAARKVIVPWERERGTKQLQHRVGNRSLCPTGQTNVRSQGARFPDAGHTGSTRKPVVGMEAPPCPGEQCQDSSGQPGYRSVSQSWQSDDCLAWATGEVTWKRAMGLMF